jgi:hypothetical protein
MSKRKPCAALLEVIDPPPAAFIEPPAYPLTTDLSEALLLLMRRLTDDDADDGIITDFAESFGLNRRAVVAAVKAYRQTLGDTVH